MTDPLSITFSALALAISGTTAWLTLFRRGTIKMTQPTVIYFGSDAVSPYATLSSSPPPSKVYLRTLLVATSKRGRVIESMHVALSRSETHQNFNIWVYGEDRLMRGSGLFVGETGVCSNHHFLTPDEATQNYRFVAGKYRLDVFAKLLGWNKPQLLFTQSLEISPEHAASLSRAGVGLYFDWGPDASCYSPHIKSQPPPPDLTAILPGLFGPREEKNN